MKWSVLLVLAMVAAVALPPSGAQTAEEWKSQALAAEPGTEPPEPLRVEDFPEDLFAATDAHATFVVDRCDGDVPFEGALLTASGPNGTLTHTTTSSDSIQGMGVTALSGDAASMFDVIGGGWCCQCKDWWGDFCAIWGSGPCCCRWEMSVRWWEDHCYCDKGAC